ncbi:hypothetical protein [Nocardioides jejuensis]|uniref:Uncharacterized protein n=1 Tax=Nocardioides jejuensis TaxID=2502782 RepID=A0A4R1BXN8_9ACTN|nr:hypothetical protein [Nocardioides jejuensis]TCJ22186.1 hypothetical protein EPD65_13505 [Nocardioides jejuensis]
MNRGQTAWRVLAAVPFVLLLAIVGIKLTAGDPNSPFNKIPGAQTIYQLGGDAPSTDVNAKLPKIDASKSASASASDSTSASASASGSESASASPTAPSSKPTAKPTKKPTSGSTGGSGGGSTPTPTPTPTPTHTQEPSSPPPTLSPQEQCEAQGKVWRKNALTGNWFCSRI